MPANCPCASPVALFFDMQHVSNLNAASRNAKKGPTGVNEERYNEEYRSSVRSGGVCGTSISIRLSLSFHNSLLWDRISSNVVVPISDSALLHACSSETKETPTRIVTCVGFTAKEKRAPDSTTPSKPLKGRLSFVSPRLRVTVPFLCDNYDSPAERRMLYTYRPLVQMPN